MDANFRADESLVKNKRFEQTDFAEQPQVIETFLAKTVQNE